MKKTSPPPSSRQPDISLVQSLVSLLTSGRFAAAEAQARSMTVDFPGFWLAWGVLGTALQQQQRSEEALVPMQEAVRLMPADAGMRCNLGSVLHDLGRFAEAEACYRKAVEMAPAHVQAHINLGSVLLDSGQAGEAESALVRAIEIAPGQPQLHFNLGVAQGAQGRLPEAETSYRKAIHLAPRHVDALHNLAVTLQAQGRLDEAEASYREVLAIVPDHVRALSNLALLLAAQGQHGASLELARRASRLAATEESKRAFAACLKRFPVTCFDPVLQEDLVQALREPWTDPSELAHTAIALLKLTPQVAAVMDAPDDIDPAALPGDALLCALLESTLICDPGMERFLTRARRTLLHAAMAAAAQPVDLRFSSALAQQCFINEYVFNCDEAELTQAQAARIALIAALENGATVATPLLLATACYFPLHSLAQVSKLLAQEWSLPVQELLIVQMVGPEVERVLGESIPQLTPIDDGVSRQVQAQYEEHPYPSWVKRANVRGARSIMEYLRQRFPAAPLRPYKATSPLEVLVAGCGTGQHALNAAQRMQGSHLLAIDLSLKSLCYAKRKAQEYGMDDIEFAQADLLQLGTVPRRFDVIESSGVLHHLADPWQGWSVLLSALRPGGFMKLGFYSELGRRNVVRIREFIADKGYSVSAQDIRRCRQELLASGEREGYADILRSPDFYSISACRDLLFHVQEHRMSWLQIDAYIKDKGLQLIGVEVDLDVLAAYRESFPQDLPALDLHNWHLFETEHPHTFSGMYQFWVQSGERSI
ncbi:MAG: tetratricopeptide repeat protein [Pseudomonadota bacterium]